MGALGCSLSHIKAIKDAQKNEYEKILLLEDDILPNRLYSRLINFLYLPEGWKFLYLGGNTSQRLENIDYLHYNFFNKSRGIAGTYAWGLHCSLFAECIEVISDLTDGCDRRLETLHKKYPRDTYICKDHIFLPDTTESSIRSIDSAATGRKWLRELGFTHDMISPRFLPPSLIDLPGELGINGHLSQQALHDAKTQVLDRAKGGALKLLQPAIPGYVCKDGTFSRKGALSRLSLFLDELFARDQVKLLEDGALPLSSLREPPPSLLPILQSWAFDRVLDTIADAEIQEDISAMLGLTFLSIGHPYKSGSRCSIRLPGKNKPEDLKHTVVLCRCAQSLAERWGHQDVIGLPDAASFSFSNSS